MRLPCGLGAALVVCSCSLAQVPSKPGGPAEVEPPSEEPSRETPESRPLHLLEVRELQASGSAIVGHPVSVTATVVVGSSSCDRFVGLTAVLDDQARTVTITALGRSLRTGSNPVCTSNIREESHLVMFSPASTGAYLVQAAESLVDRYPGRATASIEVVQGPN